jgi:O-antigen ligase
MFALITNNKNITLPLILIAFAIALQIQVTWFSNETYNGLRLNLADTTLPILGLFILIGLFLNKTTLPKFQIKHSIKWLIFLQCIMIAALLNSYIEYQEIIRWALINKTIGFAILTSYFLLGGWLANQIRENQLHLFIKTTVYFFLTAMVLQTLDYSLYYTGFLDKTIFPQFPAAGLIANKNTYFLLYLCVLTIVSCYRNLQLPPVIIFLLYALIPITLIYTGARTSVLILPILLPVLFLLTTNGNRKKVIIALIIGSLSIPFFLNFQKIVLPSFKARNQQTFNIVQINPKHGSIKKSLNQLSYPGDQLRVEILKTTIGLIKENPILGSGLGSVIKKETSEKFPNTVMDSTPLWLWAETGLIGLLAFLSFYAVCLKTIYKNGFNTENSETAQGLNKSIFVTMLIFGVMCIFHELLYTRFLWFFMGLALAYPLKEKLTPAA